MSMYNLTEYSDIYSKKSGSLWQYYRDEPVLGATDNVIHFPADNNNSISFKFKQKITVKIGKDDTKDDEIMVLLRYVNNICKILEMPLINCEINLMTSWSANCFLVASTAAYQMRTFKITDTKLYVPVVTLSTQDNAKLLKELKSTFKRTIHWNKYQSKMTTQTQNRYLNIF